MADNNNIEQGGDAVVEERVGFQMPHIYVILFVFTAIAAVLTHFIPAGLYDRVTLENGRVAINPESYRQVEATPVSLEQFMLAIPQGLVDASMVVFFTFIIAVESSKNLNTSVFDPVITAKPLAAIFYPSVHLRTNNCLVVNYILNKFVRIPNSVSAKVPPVTLRKVRLCCTSDDNTSHVCS